MERTKLTKRIAIIGGGLAGCLTALVLARRGLHCEIFEKNKHELFEASYFNEGKVHLGFLYAKDFTGETHRLMSRGAASFRTIVDELTGFDTVEALSTPFLYAVHRDSLVSPEQFAAHLSRCTEEFAHSLRLKNTAGGYVDGRRKVTYELLDKSEWVSDLDQSLFSAVFQTDEFGVDPRILAAAVSRAVRENSRVTLHTSSRVERVLNSPHRRLSLVNAEDETMGDGYFDIVVNSSWADLLRIDKSMGIPLPVDWSYRFKLANRVFRPVSAEDLSSVTVVLGAFGDIVNYGKEGGVFLSWYPSGRLLMTDDVDLADWNGEDFRSQRTSAYEDSRRIWESMSKKVRDLNLNLSEVDSRGGMILATGRLDVDDPTSLLHSRVQIGLKTRGHYISFNTGKYTVAPLMATKAADMVEQLL